MAGLGLRPPQTSTTALAWSGPSSILRKARLPQALISPGQRGGVSWPAYEGSDSYNDTWDTAVKAYAASQTPVSAKLQCQPDWDWSSPGLPLLPGPNTDRLQILEKNSAKWEKILHFVKKCVFTAMNNKISIKMACLEIFSRKKFWWQLLTIANKSRKNSYFSYNIFSAGFRLLLSKIGGRTAAKFSRLIIFLFGRFCVI
jgi:hypothetical protein